MLPHKDSVEHLRNERQPLEKYHATSTKTILNDWQLFMF
jgi:hypothetical protein